MILVLRRNVQTNLAERDTQNFVGDFLLDIANMEENAIWFIQYQTMTKNDSDKCEWMKKNVWKLGD